MLNELREFITLFSDLWHHKLFTLAGVKIGLGNLLTALVLLLFATRLSRLVTRFIEKRLIIRFVPDKSSQITYKTFAYYASLGGWVSLSLTFAGIPLTVFTVVGGALAIGVGFGSQNIVNNFISGIILLVERPVKVGDIVEVENISGVILSIGTRSTKIRNAENKIFIVPNSFFLEKSVLNWSYDTSLIRTTINFGVAYGSDVSLVENVCMDILLNTEGIEQTPIPKVLFENFNDSNLDFQLMFWCDVEKVSSLAEIRSIVRFKIDKKFKEHKLEMAFPQRDMNLKLDRTLQVKVIS
ncbi:MAG: mechanosensitive ion channel family protein [Bacteriovoracaceae bacterium]